MAPQSSSIVRRVQVQRRLDRKSYVERANVCSETIVTFGRFMLPLALVSFRLWGPQRGAFG